MANPNPSPETRFRAGGPGGPGRPRSRPLTDRLREKLEDPALLEELVDSWLAMARARDLGALRTLLERLEGKVTDRVEHDGQVTIRVEYADADGPDADDHPAEAACGAGGDPGEPGEVPRTGVRP